jgi:hypothetical protein
MLELIGYGVCLVAVLISIVALTTCKANETPVITIVAVVGVLLSLLLALAINTQAKRFSNAISVGSPLTVADTLPYDRGPDGLE